ncbi:uncharacterized protein C2845_PM04G11350 [Panicum miliaceum]|uniref:C2H2-type domain-containing protein n=1 Tax=Panicum miliaceum TaxID=4540 RepID=A0A3L6QU88_PANMI|nr:uncharacterized protein C2845_PM04G11350 [Panicum miliaceum]
MVEAAGRSAAAREAKKAISSAAAMKKKLVMSKKPEKDGSGSLIRTKKQSREPESPSYRLALKSIFSCRNSSGQQQPESGKKLGKLKHSETSSQRERVAKGEACKRRASVSGSGSERCVKKPLQRGDGSSSSSSGGSFRAGMQLRRLSGCYECHMVVDPVSGSSSMRATVFPCPDCGEIFVREESLQLHQSTRHAVCELGADDTSRNIIEIIFRSSWLKKLSPVCTVERILKVHNTARTLASFEEYRDAVKAKANKALHLQAKTKHPRCSADGNELLRFHCATLACALGLNGATHLCDAAATGCGACAIIRDGFGFILRRDAGAGGVRTMATSGRAHDDAVAEDLEERTRAMLVCRVIAGRVKRRPVILKEEEAEEAGSAEADDDDELEFDSVAGLAGVYSNLEELQVFNPRAILPCFVVVYKA